ncbi:MAG TPA: hypothetical protein VFK57_19780 [Vicinamibacterales bacterium]|nr:hypothetical protein [Vicinamibacterales bacterium]
MGLFGWLRGNSGNGDRRAWRDEWARAVASLDAGALAPLAAALRRQPPIAEDVEMEEEMLDGLRQLLDVERDLSAARLPIVDTTHRVVGADRCHFSAPVSLPDDPAQPTGRLLLTSARAVFAGGARTPALPWHGVREVVQTGRDVIIVTSRGDGDGQRFRCNSYAEALCGAAIARFLVRQARGARL